MPRHLLTSALSAILLLGAGAAFAAPADADPAPRASAVLEAPAVTPAAELEDGSCATESALAVEPGAEGASPALGGQDAIGQACYFVRYECQRCTNGVRGCNVYKCWVGPDYYYSYSCGSCGPYC